MMVWEDCVLCLFMPSCSFTVCEEESTIWLQSKVVSDATHIDDDNLTANWHVFFGIFSGTSY